MSVKSKTCEKLNQVYEQHGLQFTLDVAETILRKRKPGGKDFRTDLYGQLCETVLEVMIRDYIKTKNLNWCYAKSLVLKDIDNSESEFLTEVDFLLCTEQCIYVFECKSYSGTKKLVDAGTIIRENGNNCDVFSQNSLHLSVLKKVFDKFSRSPVYQMVLFEFSNGGMSDLREKRQRIELPCCNVNNLFKYVEARERGIQQRNWDLNYVRKALSILEKNSDTLHNKHLQYVKALHKGDNNG